MHYATANKLLELTLTITNTGMQWLLAIATIIEFSNLVRHAIDRWGQPKPRRKTTGHKKITHKKIAPQGDLDIPIKLNTV